MKLDGKVAIVTGSSSGIGEATARQLSAAGVRVVVNSAHSVDAGETLAASFADARYVQADIASADDVARLIDTTIDAYGQLDILVNNAGRTQVIPHADVDAATIDIWRAIFEVNVFGTWAMCQAALPHLAATGDGAIVNVSSIAGLRETGSSIPYASSKAALNHQTRLLAKVVGPEVRVNAVAPGLIETPWTQDWEALHAAVAQSAPLRRSGTPDDIAEVVLSLVTSSYTTGAVIAVDGGTSLV